MHQDLAAVVDLVWAYERRQFGEPTTAAEELAALWRRPRLDLARDAWLVDVGNEVAGYALVRGFDPHTELFGDLVVRQGREDAVLACVLLDLVEGRAREHVALAPPGTAVRLGFYVPQPDDERRRLLAAAGYDVVRTSYRMVGHLAAGSPRPRPPRGVRIAPLHPGRDEVAVHACLEEAFSEHFRYSPQPLEEFLHELTDNDCYDPELWLIAWDGNEVAGVVGAFAYPGAVEIDTLGVRRPWRRRGLGSTLLRSVFAELAGRGATDICLFVDAANETGAVALYRSVGLRVAQAYDCLLKELRASATGESAQPHR